MNIRTELLILLLGLTSVTACTVPNEGVEPDAKPTGKGLVSGRVVDSQGKGVANAEIIANSTDYYNKTTTAYTDASGTYRMQLPNGIAEGSYTVNGTVTIKYQGRNFTLALYAENTRKFSAYDGVVRNFKFRLTGKRTVDSEDDPERETPLGGTVEVHHQVNNVDRDNLEIILEPVGPLVDGSAGKTIVRTLPAHGYHLYDIPVGQYRISARDKATGQKLGVTIKDTFKDYAPSVTALFEEDDFIGDTRYELILLVNTMKP